MIWHANSLGRTTETLQEYQNSAKCDKHRKKKNSNTISQATDENQAKKKATHTELLFIVVQYYSYIAAALFSFDRPSKSKVSEKRSVFAKGEFCPFVGTK